MYLSYRTQYHSKYLNEYRFSSFQKQTLLQVFMRKIQNYSTLYDIQNSHRGHQCLNYQMNDLIMKLNICRWHKENLSIFILYNPT